MCFSSDKDAHHSLNLKEEIHFSVRGGDKWKELHLCYQHEVQLAQLSTFFSLERRYPTCCRAYFFDPCSTVLQAGLAVIFGSRTR